MKFFLLYIIFFLFYRNFFYLDVWKVFFVDVSIFMSFCDFLYVVDCLDLESNVWS